MPFPSLNIHYSIIWRNRLKCQYVLIIQAACCAKDMSAMMARFECCSAGVCWGGGGAVDVFSSLLQSTNIVIYMFHSVIRAVIFLQFGNIL
jgi:ABC-type Co2+ transport system permease subunit